MKESVKRELLKKRNVVLVYTGKKVVAGVETERMSIRVGVVRKVSEAQLATKDIIPKIIEGMQTDVFETEEIKALAVGHEVDRKSRIRPAPGGVSIGHPLITAGTLGMIVKKKGVNYILSNNHVLADCNDALPGDQTWQPGRHDGGRESDTIGHLAAFVPIHFINESSCPIANAIVKAFNALAGLLNRKTRLPNPVSALSNKVDCAISKPLFDEDISQEILEIGKPVGFGEAKVGDRVKKSGRTTKLTEGNVIAIDGAVNISYGEKVAVFEDQIITSAMSEGGDSGSAVLNGKNIAVGLLFAGSISLTIMNKISNVIEALHLDRN